MAARPSLGSACFGFSRVSSVLAFLVARRFDGDRPVLFSRRLRSVPHPARFPAVPLRCSLCLPVRAGAGGCRAGFPFSCRCGIVHPSRASNAFLHVGLLPGARRSRFPAAQMLISSVMYTFLVGFQRTPGFLCASSLASCVASRGLGRPHETRAKAHRAFDAG